MLTLFTTAKPFKGHIAVIQRNALQSWKALHPDVEVIIFGDDEGSADVCREFGFRHEPQVEQTEFGALRLDDMFEKAQKLASYPLVCYTNCDIVLLSDFWAAVQQIQHRKEPFLLIGKRWDTDVTHPLDFKNPAWQDELRSQALAQDKRRRYEVDYFLFPRGMYRAIPPFGLGRLYWDHWLVWRARSLRVPVIDASRSVIAVHQNHDYSHHPKGWQAVWQGPEPQRNWELTGNGKYRHSFEDATHRLNPRGIMPNWTYCLAPTRRRLWSVVQLVGNKVHWAFQTYVWHPVLNLTRPVRHAFGLRQKTRRAQVKVHPWDYRS